MPRGLGLVDEARLQGRLWGPQVLRPALWLDAADLSTITIATGVNAWRDKSGRGRNLSQSTPSRQPTYELSGINGRPALRAVSSSAQFLDAGANLIGFNGGAGAHLWAFVVCTMDASASSFSRLVSYGRDGQSDTGLENVPLMLRNAGNNAITAFSGGVKSSVDVMLSTPLLLGSVYGSTNHQMFLNGAAATPSAGGFGVNTTPRIRILSDGTSHWSGLCGEVILGDFELSVKDRQLIEGYLAWKWGLQTNLLSTHPFVNRPPMIGD